MRVLYVDDDRINALLFDAACSMTTGIEIEVEKCGQWRAGA